jgi:monofunctional biosynthetic peptidoglycan transglycosylase
MSERSTPTPLNQVPLWVQLVASQRYSLLGSIDKSLRRTYQLFITIATFGVLARVALSLLDRTLKLSKRSIFLVTLLAVLGPLFSFRWLNPPTPLITFAWRRHHPDGVPMPMDAFKWATIENMSSALVSAVVAGEDPYFFWHLGFNPLFIWRAFKYNRFERPFGKNRQGGSTITQQVAKNLFLWPSQSYFRKAIEALLTLLIEGMWSKARILETYLNIAAFGEGTFGVEAAAHHFFLTTAAELTAGQAALLVAALPSPQRHQVANPPREMLERHAMILERMELFGDEFVKQLAAS